MTAGLVFHENTKEMTMSIDQHIEELRAEARGCHPDERRWIEEELARALEERDASWAAEEASVMKPPS